MNSNETRKLFNHFKHMIEDLPSECYTIHELDELIDYMDSRPDDDTDIEFVKLLPVIVEKDLLIGRAIRGTWRENWYGIYIGDYPLESLPEHVRDTAASLYYGASIPS